MNEYYCRLLGCGDNHKNACPNGEYFKASSGMQLITNQENQIFELQAKLKEARDIILPIVELVKPFDPNYLSVGELVEDMSEYLNAVKWLENYR